MESHDFCLRSHRHLSFQLLHLIEDSRDLIHLHHFRIRQQDISPPSPPRSCSCSCSSLLSLDYILSNPLLPCRRSSRVLSSFLPLHRPLILLLSPLLTLPELSLIRLFVFIIISPAEHVKGNQLRLSLLSARWRASETRCTASQSRLMRTRSKDNLTLYRIASSAASASRLEEETCWGITRGSGSGGGGGGGGGDFRGYIGGRRGQKKSAQTCSTFSSICLILVSMAIFLRS